MSRSVSEFARQLREHGYHVVLSSSALAPGELSWPHGRPDITVLRKPNLGYDFGSWAVALAEVPEILTARRVLFVNDSFAGPFWPISTVLENFERSGADVWGLARSMEFEPHLQSYFFGMRGEALRSTPARRFWSSIGIRSDREDVVQQYEIGLTRMLHRHSFSVHAMFDCEAVTPGAGNPSLFGWREFLRADVPFVKRQLLRDKRIGWQAGTIPKFLRDEYGIEISEWLSDEERGEPASAGDDASTGATANPGTNAGAGNTPSSGDDASTGNLAGSRETASPGDDMSTGANPGSAG